MKIIETVEFLANEDEVSFFVANRAEASYPKLGIANGASKRTVFVRLKESESIEKGCGFTLA
jgi:hypothetical protein